jgi:glycosyltransferase involved in cell wall biosynthesis
LKIINIIQGTDLGGMEQASLRLMLGLKELGHSLEVLSLNPIGSLGPLLEKHAIAAKGLPYHGKGGWRSFLQLIRKLLEVQADALIMTGHHLLSMLAMGDLCAGRRVLAIHFHHSGVKPDWQWRLIYRVACKRFQTITFPSDFVRKEAESLYPPVKSLSHTVRNPLLIPTLPGPEDRKKARRAFGLPEDAPVIGNAGWLIPRKRFDVFLQVARKVVQDMPSAFFLIAGDGEERLRLEALAKQMNIADRVKWLGWQKDLTFFFQCLDVMLFNSDWDAMGLSPLEAMSHGVPLVASVQQGGLKEIIDKEEYGFLIPTHDVDALAGKTIYFLQNPHEARKVALAGRHRVEAISNIEQHVKIMESLIQGTNISENNQLINVP